MFKCSTIKIKYNRKKEATLLDQAYDVELNEYHKLFVVINEIKKLQTDLEKQIRYKRNKEYLYTNCNRIKKRFYHYRDEHNHPRITVCILYDLKEKIACRGISICSFVDPTDKENGRDRAEDRAIEAYITMDNSERILQEIPVENAKPIKLKVDKIIKSVKSFDDEIKEKFKSAVNVELTEFEKRLFQISK